MAQKQSDIWGDNNRDFKITPIDFRNILDELPEPALLISSIGGEVISINSQFAEIFQTGLLEVKALTLNQLLPGIEIRNLHDGEIIDQKILIKNNQELTVGVKPKIIGNKDHLILLIINIFEKKNTKTKYAWENLAKVQTDVLSRIHEIPFRELINCITNLAKKITNGDEAVIYVEQDSPRILKKISIDKSSFPDQIPKMELERIKEVDFWQPGKRVLSEIHRVGRLNKFNSIITVPISKNDQPYGLLLSASAKPEIFEIRQEILDYFSNWIGTVLEFYENSILQKESLDINSEGREKLELFVNNSSDSYIVIDENKKILEFNPNFLKLIDYLPIEVLNKNLDQILGNSELNYLIDDQTTTDELEGRNIEIFDRSGKNKCVLGKCRLFNFGGFNRRMIILRDISEHVAAKNHLLDLQKSADLGEMLAEFSHDVRNIVNRITTGLQLILKRLNPEGPTLANIQDMQGECITITELLESVLSFSSQKSSSYQPVNLNEMIGRIFYRFKDKTDSANISLILNSMEDKYLVSGDLRSLDRAFSNLINNGIEAIGTGGGAVSANVSDSEDPSEFILVQIADTGPGIPPEIESNLFGRYITGKKGGTGLGLSISRKIIESHKGWIDLETFPGGTIFNIYLPILH